MHSLKGKRLCFISEVSEDGKRINTMVYKQLADNEEVSGRALYRNKTTWVNVTSIFWSVNDMPALMDPEKAGQPLPPSLERRTLLIRYLSRFTANSVLINAGEGLPIDPSLSQNMSKLTASVWPLSTNFILIVKWQV